MVDVQSDLTAIGSLANVPLVMVVQPAKGYKTVHDFVAAAKAKPGTFTYGSGGRGDQWVASRILALDEFVHGWESDQRPRNARVGASFTT